MTDDKEDDAQPVSAANLDDAFDAADEDQEEVGETAKTPETTETDKGEDEDETVDEAEESEDEAETPAAEDKHEGKSVPVAALKSERQKRQQAEARVAELEKRNAPTEERGEMDLDSKLFAERTNMSREMMMESKPDYQEMENIFTEIATGNQHLIDQMMKSHNPAKFAYEKAKEHVAIEEAKKLKDSDEYKEFLKLKAEGKTKPVAITTDEKRKQSVLAVPKLNKAASLGSNSTPKENLDTLDDMFEE